MGELLKLLPILVLAFYIAFIPHQHYPYLVHWSEWNHMAYFKAMLQAGSATFVEPFYGQSTTDIGSNMYAGFHLFWVTFQQITGVSWLTIFRYFPGIIFMITVLSVYVLAWREDFGWEAAFFTCLVPTSLGIFGPGFMVPLVMGLLFIPLSLFLAFNFKTWPCYLLLFIFTCFLLSMHAPTAVGLVIILLPYILLNLRGNFRHSLGITVALAIPFLVTFLWAFEMLLPTAKLLLTPQLPTPWVELPPLMQTYGYMPIIFGFLGTILLAIRGGKKNFGLVLGLLALLLMMVVFFRFHYGLPILYERGLTHMMLVLGIIAGAGLLWVRTIRLPGKSTGERSSFLRKNLGNILCSFLIGVTLAVSIPSRLNTYYYHMIDHEDYQAFVWIRDNVGEDYGVAVVDPWKATAFTAITQKNVRRRISLYKEPVDDIIYQFLQGGCGDTAFLRDSGISMVYNRLSCSNTDLVEVRKDVYLTNPNLSWRPGALQNAGFEAIYGDPPAPWHTWSRDCEPTFLYPEPGRDGDSCVGIEMFETEPFEPWPSAIWSQGIPVEAGKSYRVEGWVRTENIVGWGGAMIVPEWKGPGYTWIGATEFMSYVKGTSGWTYCEGEVTAPPGATLCNLCCYMGGCSGKAWFDDMVFEESGGEH
ncbi:MAG TPA: hypothetical protein G4O12_07405 [Dehalococcoidia bacterium]|nr:hypothetical protein [Dehalococcoidia bacterium]